MLVVASFDPAAATSGYMDVSAAGPDYKILLYNRSIVDIKLTFDNGDTALLHSGEANYWTLDGLTPNLEWMQYSKLNVTQAAISQVSAQLYRPDEEITGTYPMSLVYQLNVGNVVTTSGGFVAQLQNDGNIATQQFIESTVAGDTGSSVSVTVDGTFLIGTTLHKGSLTLVGPFSVDNGTITSNGAGVLTVPSIKCNSMIDSSDVNTWASVSPGVSTRIQNAAAVAIQVPGGSTVLGIVSTGANLTGALSVSGAITGSGTLNQIGTITDTGGTSWAAVTAGSVTRIQSPGTIALQVPGGSTRLTINSTDVISGVQLTAPQFILGGSSGNYSLYTNSLSRLSDFSGTGSVTVNHNLGAAPTYAQAWCDAAASSQTMGTTWNTTQCTVVTGAALHWHGMAMRY